MSLSLEVVVSDSNSSSVVRDEEPLEVDAPSSTDLGFGRASVAPFLFFSGSFIAEGRGKLIQLLRYLISKIKIG